MSELQQSCERLRRIAAGERGKVIYGWGDVPLSTDDCEEIESLRLRDQRMLANAYLALFDHTPITEEYLHSLGFKFKQYQGGRELALGWKSLTGDQHWIETTPDSFTVRGSFTIRRWSDLFDDDMPPDMVEVQLRTRGDLRRLCSALSIDLKEPT